MPPYYSKIVVSRKPKKLCINTEIVLGYDNCLSLEMLKNYGITDSSNFSVMLDDNNQYILHIQNYRFETKEETKIRVKKETDYNKKYEEYHNKK